MGYYDVIEHLKHGWQLVYWHQSYNFVLHKEDEKKFVHSDVVDELRRDLKIKEEQDSEVMTVYKLSRIMNK